METANMLRKNLCSQRRNYMKTTGVPWSTDDDINAQQLQAVDGVDTQIPTLSIIVRCDKETDRVTLAAVLRQIELIAEKQCDLRVISCEVGPPTADDVKMAEANCATIYNLNTFVAKALPVNQGGVRMHVFSDNDLLTSLISAVKEEMDLVLRKLDVCELVGYGRVTEVTHNNNLLVLVESDLFQKNSVFKFSRGSKVIYEGDVESMKCDMEVVTNAKTNTEVGIALDNKNIRFETGDVVEVYEQKQVEQKIDWSASIGGEGKVAGWKDELPVPDSIVLEASSMDVAQRAVAYREWQKMQKAAVDWEATEGKRTEEREAYLANKKSLLDREIRDGSSLRRIVHKKNLLERVTDDRFPQLNIILKCDMQGTLEAIMKILDSHNCEDQCKLSFVDFAVGAPTERDVEVAKETSAVIYSFNVRASPAVRSEAERSMVPLEQFNVIDRLVEALPNELSSRLPKKEELELIGKGHVSKEFLNSDRGRKRQPIFGCLVNWGNFKKNSVFKFSRGSKVIYDGDVESMKCDMEVVTNAKTNTEVGIALDNKNIRFETGDAIEVYEKKQVEQRIQWSPAGF